MHSQRWKGGWDYNWKWAETGWQKLCWSDYLLFIRISIFWGPATRKIGIHCHYCSLAIVIQRMYGSECALFSLHTIQRTWNQTKDDRNMNSDIQYATDPLTWERSQDHNVLLDVQKTERRWYETWNLNRYVQVRFSW